MNKHLKRLTAVILLLMLLVQQIPGMHVHAGIVCDDCGNWSEEYCPRCHLCLDCTEGWCDNCEICLVCAMNLDNTIHCIDCFETCFMDESVSMCMECMRCADCCGDMIIDEWGGLCRECAESSGAELCPECDDNIIRDSNDDDTEYIESAENTVRSASSRTNVRSADCARSAKRSNCASSAGCAFSVRWTWAVTANCAENAWKMSDSASMTASTV